MEAEAATVTELARSWGWIISMGLTGFIAWVGWTIRQNFVTRHDHDEALEGVNKRIDGVAKDASDALRNTEELERKISDLPAKEDLHALELSMSQLNGKVDLVAAQGKNTEKTMDGISRAVGRIDEYLRKSEAKS